MVYSPVKNANDIIYRLTPDGFFSYVSPEFCDLLGYEIREIEGEVFTLLVHPDDIPICLGTLRRAMETGEKHSEVEYRVKHKDGTWKWHTSNLVVVRDASGKVLSIDGMTHDIGERKLAEETLQESEERFRNLVESANNYEDALCLKPEGRNRRSLSSAPPSSPHLTEAAQVIPLTPKPTSHRTLPRRRGIVLSEQGWQKLLQADVLYNQLGERCYTYEMLGEKTLLDPHTIRRILGRTVGVDRRTLKIFFTAFNLQLEPDDYTTPQPKKREPATHSRQRTSTNAEIEELQQQICQDCSRLIALMGLHNIRQATVSIKLSPHTSPQLELNIQQVLLKERAIQEHQ